MTKIVLLKPHTHAGVQHPPGTPLYLHDDQAAWLVSLEVAKPAEAKRRAAAPSRGSERDEKEN